jgi:hypothetical protein
VIVSICTSEKKFLIFSPRRFSEEEEEAENHH